MLHNYETEKITRKASDTAEYMSYLVLLSENVMQDRSNVILLTSTDICVVHDDLGWKNQTTCYKILQVFCHITGFTSDFLGQNNRTARYNRFWRAGCSRLEYINIPSVY